MSAPHFVALICAAGVGARAGGDTPKQYKVFAGAPLIAHTIGAMGQHPRVARIVVAISETDGWMTEISEKETSARLQILRTGGASRAETVRNTLVALRAEFGDETWVLVHDAARCCITPALIDRLIVACERDACGGLLALPAPDTLKQSNLENRSVSTIDRSHVWYAQTPQMFRLGELLDALSTADLATVTDEASAMEQAGFSPKLVLGAPTNLKVTYPEDFLLAEAILCHAAQSRPG